MQTILPTLTSAQGYYSDIYGISVRFTTGPDRHATVRGPALIHRTR